MDINPVFLSFKWYDTIDYIKKILIILLRCFLMSEE